MAMLRKWLMLLVMSSISITLFSKPLMLSMSTANIRYNPHKLKYKNYLPQEMHDKSKGKAIKPIKEKRKKKPSKKLVCASQQSTRAECATSGSFGNHGTWVRGEANDAFLTTIAQRRGFVWPNETYASNVGRILMWKWKAACSETCTYAPMTRENMCKVLGPYRRVFFVGDSVQSQFASSLVTYIGGPRREYKDVTTRNHKNKPYPHDKEWNVCERENEGKPTRVTYLRDDFLWSNHNLSFGGTITIKTKSNNDRVTNIDWLHSPEIYNASEDLIVMSAGPHYHDEEKFNENAERLAAKVADHLQTVATTKNANPIVYRYSVGGHPKCDSHKMPIDEIGYQKMWEQVRSSTRSKAVYMDKYSWHLQTTYNKMQLDAFERHNVSIVKFDVETASKLRPDAHNHGDCLHLRMPGLMDLWAVWLVNYLEAFASAQKPNEGLSTRTGK